MSDANIYQPHVFIDGVKLQESAPVYALSPVAKLKVTWGGDEWYENIEAARLDLVLLDPYGDFIGLAKQQEIVVTRDPNGEVVFRGRIDEVFSEYARSTDPRTGTARDMWAHQVRAYDELAVMQRDRRRGPLYNSRDIAPERLHWGPCDMNERKRDIENRAPAPIIWERTPIDQYDQEAGVIVLIRPVSAYERQQVVSLLTVLRNTARISAPLNRVYYFPADHSIRFVSARGSFASGLRNRRNASAKIVLGLGATHEVMLSGKDFSIGDRITASTSNRESITRVEVTLRTTRPTSFITTTEGRYMENVEGSYEMTLERDAAQQMTAQVESDHSEAYLYSGTMVAWGIATTEATAGIYGSAKFEPLRYEFDKHDAAPAWALPWLTAAPPLDEYQNPVTYTLTESLTNWIPNTLPFSVVGGLIEYTHSRGWAVELNPAPRGVESPVSPPTLGDIKDTQILANVGDQSIVADWQHLKQAT